MPIGPISSAYIPQASVTPKESNTAPTKPDPKAMSHGSHILIATTFQKISQATSALDKLAVKIQDSKVTLDTLRKATYESVDGRSNTERGPLRSYATREDNQKYNHLLKEFGALGVSLKQRADQNSYLNMDLLLQSLKAQPLHDDFNSLMGPQVPAYIYKGNALIPPQQIAEAFECITHSTSAIDELAAKLTEFEIDLRDLRLTTYENIDLHTNLTKAPLTQEEMKKAQKNYIDKLYEFNALRTNTQELSKGNPYFNMDSILHIHESSPIYGDLDALNSGQSIPNLKYSDRAGSMDIDFSKLG